MDKRMHDILEEHKDSWIRLSKSISCGGCGETTTVESKYTCSVCGRMLCGACGRECRDHTSMRGEVV